VKFKDRKPADARAFETRVRVQWGDVDVAGIMYFAAYWRVAERAEMDMFRELGFPYAEIFERYDIWLPRVHVEADYHAPALMDDWLRVRTHVEKVGASSVRWRTVVLNERTGNPGAELTLTIACMDRASGHSKPMPPEMRAALLACVGSDA
jgi:YbgC/YbaW family acyl-CoA thioester hydrolase